MKNNIEVAKRFGETLVLMLSKLVQTIILFFLVLYKERNQNVLATSVKYNNQTHANTKNI